MAIVLRSLGGGQGGNILTVSPEQGGHYATKDLANSFGLNVDFIHGLNEYLLDYDSLEKQLFEKEYTLIYLDQSHCLFPIDIKKVSEIVKKVSPNTLIHVDISHCLGLVFGKTINNPLEDGADSFGGSTHKTFPGPQRAVFCTNNTALAEIIDNNQNFMVSSHHFGTVASLGIALLEFKEMGGEKYTKQIIKNSKILAENLYDYGYDVKG